MLPEGVGSRLCLCPAPALAPPSPRGWKRRGSRWGEKGEGVREGKAPVPGDGLNLEEKASWRKKVTTRNSRKRMKCDRKVGLREITAAKNKHPKPAMGERKRSVNQKKWGCITALRPALLRPGWGEPGGGLGLGLRQGQDLGEIAPHPRPEGLCTGTSSPIPHPTAATSHPTAPRGCPSPYSSAGARG